MSVFSGGGLCYVKVPPVACTNTEVANSDFATTGSITGVEGDTVAITCDSGYSGSGTTTCSSAAFSTVTCSANACTATEVANSDFATTGSIIGNTADTVTITCDSGYSGTDVATCATTGEFNVVTCSANACIATEISDSDYASVGSITGVTGDTVTITCDGDLFGSGPVTCGADGEFTTITCSVSSVTVTNSEEVGNTLQTFDVLFWNVATSLTSLRLNMRYIVGLFLCTYYNLS